MLNCSDFQPAGELFYFWTFFSEEIPIIYEYELICWALYFFLPEVIYEVWGVKHLFMESLASKGPANFEKVKAKAQVEKNYSAKINSQIIFSEISVPIDYILL